MADVFKSEMTLARRLLDTVLHPTDAEPILAALLDAEIAHDRQAHEAAEALTCEVERRREAEAERDRLIAIFDKFGGEQALADFVGEQKEIKRRIEEARESIKRGARRSDKRFRL